MSESKIYIVERRECWVQGVAVKARSEDEARDLVNAGEGEVLGYQFEYSETLDDRPSNVREATEDELDGCTDLWDDE